MLACCLNVIVISRERFHSERYALVLISYYYYSTCCIVLESCTLSCTVRSTLCQHVCHCVSTCRGVSDFEGWCVDNEVDVEFDVLTQLYADPLGPAALAQLPPRLRSKARSCVEQACNLRMNEVGRACCGF